MRRILFVCLGNICRSVTAQTIMQQLIDENGLKEKFHIDSAGLIAYHQGEMADSRMRSHASKRGYNLTHRSRPVTQSDFNNFDLIIGMDDANIKGLKKISPNIGESNKIHKITEYCITRTENNVPDPYYGGETGFEIVLDILEDACKGLLEQLCGQD